MNAVGLVNETGWSGVREVHREGKLCVSDVHGLVRGVRKGRQRCDGENAAAQKSRWEVGERDNKFIYRQNSAC